MTLKTLEYVTDNKGKKKAVMMSIAEFHRMQEEVEDLQDSLTLEKAKKQATGFKKWKEFVKELDAHKKAA